MMPTRAQEAQAVRPRGWGQGYGDCVPLMPAPHTGLIEQILLLSQQLCVLLIVLGGLLGTATMNVLLQLWSSACWRQAVPHWLLAPWTWQWPAQHMGACSRALTANTKPCVAGASAGGGGGGFVWANGITVTPGQGYTVTVGAGGTGPGRAGGNSWFISEATMVARGGGGGQKAGGAAGTFALGTGVTGAGFIGGIGGEAVGLSHPGRQQVTTCVVGLDGKLLHLSHPCVPVGQTSSCGTVCLGQGREDEFCLADSTAGSCTPPHMPMVAVLAIRTVLRHSGSPLSPLVSTHSPPPPPPAPLFPTPRQPPPPTGFQSWTEAARDIAGGGGGAGGYAGAGGQGGSTPVLPDPGTGGGGGGGRDKALGIGGGGGGTGVLGQGANGAAGTPTSVGGGGGSGGGTGTAAGSGGAGGGGAGGRIGAGNFNQTGGAGRCRIIWGPDRAYPSSNTGDLSSPPPAGGPPPSSGTTGQVVFDTAGTFTWTAPTGVTSVSAACIGGGGGAGSYGSSGNAAGGGGGCRSRRPRTFQPCML